MRLAELTEEARHEMLLRAQSAPECQHALAQLAGEVLEIRITGMAVYRLAFRDGTVQIDPGATPTMTAEGTPEVIEAILQGKLDPLAAILTRRLKAALDPLRGPLLRTVLRAGITRETRDMGWDRVIGKVPAPEGGPR